MQAALEMDSSAISLGMCLDAYFGPSCPGGRGRGITPRWAIMPRGITPRHIPSMHDAGITPRHGGIMPRWHRQYA